MSWEKRQVNEICLKVTDGAHHSPPSVEDGFAMASSKDMRENDFDLSNVRRISETDYQKLVDGNCKPLVGDVLIIKDGNSYLKYAFAVKEERELVLLSSIAILRPDQKLIDPIFFQYLLRSPYVKKEMENYVSGAAIPRIVLKDFKSMWLTVPPLPTQRRIASILSAYDNLIENNLKRIKLLEEAAQNIYREWFVEMRFPDHEQVKWVEDEQGRKLPEGWELGNVGLLAKVKSGYAFKSKHWTDKGNPVIKIKNIDGNTVKINECDFVDDEIVVSLDRFELFAGDLLIAMTGATVGKVGVMPRLNNNYYLNQRVGLFKSNPEKENYTSILFSFFLTGDAQQQVNNLAQGAAQPNISASQIESIELNIPTDDLLIDFIELVDPMLDQIIVLHSNNYALKEARDILLPRLMNQTIEV